MAITQEAYFTDNDKYAGNLEELRKGEFFVESAIEKGVIIKIMKVSPESFVAEGSSPDCDENKDGKPDVYVWDSKNGGLQGGCN